MGDLELGLRSPDVAHADIEPLAYGAATRGSLHVSHLHGRVPNVRGAASLELYKTRCLGFKHVIL
jgi:hypothetical protein